MNKPLVVAACFAAAVAASGCVSSGHGRASGPWPGWKPSYRFTYYPDSGVYYAASRDAYIWCEGGAWRTATNPPDHVLVRLTDPVTVTASSREPWLEHETHLAQHPPREPEPLRPDRLDGMSAFVSD